MCICVCIIEWCMCEMGVFFVVFYYNVWYHLVTATSCIISIISTLDAAIQCNMLCAFFLKGHFMEKERRKMTVEHYYQDVSSQISRISAWPLTFPCNEMLMSTLLWNFMSLASSYWREHGTKKKICILLSEDHFIYNRVAVFKWIFNTKWIQRP